MFMRVSWPSDKKLKIINKILLTLIIVVNSIILLAPFWPQAEYAIDSNITKPVKDDFADLDRNVNQLVIPSLQIQEKIYEGNTASVLSQGLWHRPNTSTPPLGGNTVIAGHRFTYKSKPPFYHLDKLSIGDELAVVYDKKIYIYMVTEQKITNPNDQTVEASSTDDRLTLYTCTPLWTAENRLIYTSNLERIIP